MGVPLLETHGLEVFIAIALFHWVFLAADYGLGWIANISSKQKKAWAINVVSMIHAIYAIRVNFIYYHRLAHDPVFGYDEIIASALAVSLGYFIWDAYISILYSGIGFAIHGVACAGVFLLAYRPFLMHFGVLFLGYELSTPFLNVHHLLVIRFYALFMLIYVGQASSMEGWKDSCFEYVCTYRHVFLC